MRYLYTIIQTFRFYRCLHHKKKQRLNTITQLKPETLAHKNIQCLALDFDGVLNAHAEMQLKAEVKTWLDEFLQHWPQDKIVILSNKPNQTRIQYFKGAYPQIGFCQQVRKKPYPDGLIQIAKQQGISPSQVLLVDDRLLTGMLACCLSGAEGLWVNKPYKRWLKRPLRETFFASLRLLERVLIL